MDNVSAKIFEAATAMPYGGYEIADDSYLYRGSFGQVDLYVNVFCTTVTRTWHTIALIPDGFQPNRYRKMTAYIKQNDGTLFCLECYAYDNGNINVCNPLPTGQYHICVLGSYITS